MTKPLIFTARRPSRGGLVCTSISVPVTLVDAVDATIHGPREPALAYLVEVGLTHPRKDTEFERGEPRQILHFTAPQGLLDRASTTAERKGTRRQAAINAAMADGLYYVKARGKAVTL